MNAQWRDDLELAKAAARAAGDVVMKTFQSDQHVTYKSPDQPLTAADLAADALLHARLLGARPEYGWLSEETADNSERLLRDSVWLVDPLDGTRSYVAGRPEFAISIGLSFRGAAVLGVVFNPATNEMFTALRGEGAYAGDRRLRAPGEPRRSIMAASRSEIARGEFDAFKAEVELLPTGSTACKLAKVADGSADIFLSRGPKSEWDVCAGALIVHEAGGHVTDLHGNTLQYNQPNPHIDGVLAARTPLHQQMLDRLKELNT